MSDLPQLPRPVVHRDGSVSCRACGDRLGEALRDPYEPAPGWFALDCLDNAVGIGPHRTRAEAVAQLAACHDCDPGATHV